MVRAGKGAQCHIQLWSVFVAGKDVNLLVQQGAKD